ncbi:MAG: hypothetical protein JNL74_08125 [Fibrobacteres bacterium]|nr:hypothetical protein [Fibrobacterota bacterium]
MHEYTISLLFWIAPVVIISLFFLIHKTLKPVPLKAMLLNLAILTSIGFILDLLFAKLFFTFPNPSMTLGIDIRGIPIEEFAFYLFGFWFIILFYIFNDEFFLKRYNVSDELYVRFAGRLKRSVYVQVTIRSISVFLILTIGATVIKRIINPNGMIIPGYFIFLSALAYVPWIFFWRVTRNFVNTRALLFTILTTLCISIIWEVTLALPRGYWNYQHGAMIGAFIPCWSNLPVEAVTVWIFCSLIILSYEYTKLMLHKNND